jgi:cytochrome b
MNATSSHPSNETQAPANTATRDITVLIWDAPVRVFHWLMALCFAGAYATAEGESWRLVHVTLGYTLAGLVAFRIVWGFIGTRHARFSSFVKGPQAVTRYCVPFPVRNQNITPGTTLPAHGRSSACWPWLPPLRQQVG